MTCFSASAHQPTPVPLALEDAVDGGPCASDTKSTVSSAQVTADTKTTHRTKILSVRGLFIVELPH
jgi:hypothetical protein